jgi:hypothetical protein
MEMMTSFFDYTCDSCGQPVCERLQVMNLALDNVEDLLCMTCLSTQEETPAPVLSSTLYAYIQSRECFKTPWDNFDAGNCPNKPLNTCYCQDKQ